MHLPTSTIQTSTLPLPVSSLQQLGRHKLSTTSVATLERAEAKVVYGFYLGEQKKVGPKQEAVWSQVAPTPPRGSTCFYSHLMAMSTHFSSLQIPVAASESPGEMGQTGGDVCLSGQCCLNSQSQL